MSHFTLKMAVRHDVTEIEDFRNKTPNKSVDLAKYKKKKNEMLQ